MPQLSWKEIDPVYHQMIHQFKTFGDDISMRRFAEKQERKENFRGWTW